MKKLNVFLTSSSGLKMAVGTLAIFGSRIVFEYTKEFLAKNIQISPYYLSLREGLFEFH